MNNNFWEKLPNPFFCSAPMHEASDSAFRQVLFKYSKPDVVFTEFISVDALCNPKSRDKIAEFFLKFNKDIEKPIVVQLWGNDPVKFGLATSYVRELGFDGIDINMGCPSRTVINTGGGAALIQDKQLAVSIIKAVKDNSGGLPVSVKTRIGFDVIDTDNWINAILEARPDAITIHGRTKKELSKTKVHWEEINKAALLAKKAGVIVIGNGDIKDIKEAREKAQIYNLDGVMIGRALFGNPWFFDPSIDYKNITKEQKMEALIYHAEIFESDFRNVKKFYRFRKMIGPYISGFDGAKELRIRLMKAENSKELTDIIQEFIKND